MPTGYTAAIADGITFEQFAMSCARAFGATIDMRDAPAGTEIPERFEPSGYHLNKAKELQERLALLEAMTEADASCAAQHDYEEKLSSCLKSIERIKTLRVQYEAMLEQVNAWEPPSDDHVEMRAFMIDQIQKSINWDCDETFYSRPEPVRPEMWRKVEFEIATGSHAYHEKAYREEVERTSLRNEWMRLLRESLKKFHH